MYSPLFSKAPLVILLSVPSLNGGSVKDLPLNVPTSSKNSFISIVAPLICCLVKLSSALTFKSACD